MNRITGWLRTHDTQCIAIFSVLIFAVATTYYYFANDILAYGDAESHLNIAKRVVSGLTPGLGQLGGVWLPLHHLIMAPFVINDFMWRTGLGGAVVASISAIIASVFVYKTALLLTEKRWIALIAFTIFALNPNTLYMAATPMSELPLLAFMTASFYFFIKWIKDPQIYLLVLTAFLTFCGSLIRYDAWFVAVIQALIIVLIGISKHWNLQKIEGILILFGTLAFFSALLWLMWCFIIFHDPLYFMNSPFSAKSQQFAFLARNQLPTYHNILQSLLYYGGAIVANTGLILTVISVVGLLVYSVYGRDRLINRMVIILLIVSPIIFNVIALVLGISILYVPGITPTTFLSTIFNVRYGMMAIPAVALFAALLIAQFSKYKIIARLLGTVTLISVLLFSISFPTTLQDGLHGLSVRNPEEVSPINPQFRQHYDHRYVAYDDYSRSADAVDLGIPMDKIIYVGSHPYWEEMIQHPNNYARWVIIRNDPNDSLYKAFHNNKLFADDYRVVATSGSANLYKCTNNCTSWAK